MRKNRKIRPTHFLRLAGGCDIWILLSVLLLALYGLLMIGSASMGMYVGDNFHLAITVGKQLLFVVFGYIMMCFASNHFRLSSLHGNGFLCVIVLMELALLACLAFAAVGGAHAWIRIPNPIAEVTIQPSEFAKVVAVLVMAAYIGDSHNRKRSLWDICLMPFLIAGTYALTILFLQNDTGSAAVLVLMCYVVFLIPKHPSLHKFRRVINIVFLVLVGLVVFLITPPGMQFIEALPLLPYQKSRFLSSINPFIDQYGSGYQLVNGLISFAKGGLFGVGFGKSTIKYGNFPAANTDFILAILVEETGFVGFLVLIGLYSVLIVRLFLYARKMKSEKGRMILIGTAMYFLIHIFLNVGGATGMIPLTGIPLPLMSAGGSSAMSMMLSVGLSQAVISQYQKGEIQ